MPVNFKPFPPMRDDESTVIGGKQARELNELIDRLSHQCEELFSALNGVITVADRKTDEFDAAHKAIANTLLRQQPDAAGEDQQVSLAPSGARQEETLKARECPPPAEIQQPTPKAGDAGDMSGAELLRNIHSHKCNAYCNRCLDLIAAYGHQRWTGAREACAEFVRTHAVATATKIIEVLPSTGSETMANAIRAMRPGDGG